MSTIDSQPDTLASALRTLKTEQSGLVALEKALINGLSKPFEQAVSTLRNISGRVIVTGVGKSGHIATKLAATLASTGTPAFFVHSAEANHGDLGMIARDDAIIALSWSGETTELRGTLDYSKRFSIPLIAITSNPNSTLANHAQVVLALPKEQEACPHNLAPTTSAIMQMAVGDALAVALLESRKFTAGDFSVFHPGGKLGAQLLRIGDMMHSGAEVPLIRSGSQMTEAILQISGKGFGCVGVTNNNDDLIGIITDGDLARHLSTDLLEKTVDAIMTRDPKTIDPDMLAVEALDILNTKSISALIVTEGSKPVGIVHFHDLLRVGVA